MPTNNRRALRNQRKGLAPNPEKAGNIKGLTLKEMMKATPAYFSSKALNQVKVVKHKVGTTDKRGHKFIKASLRSRPDLGGSGDVHKAAIIALGTKSDRKKGKPGTKLSKGHCLVTCTCDSFLYRCEYALTKHGASTIKHSNGKPAKVTNPSNIPMLCIHLYKLANSVKNKGM